MTSVRDISMGSLACVTSLGAQSLIFVLRLLKDKISRLLLVISGK